MKIFKKASLLVSIVLAPSLLGGCAMNTKFETQTTLCRRYYLMRDVTFVENDVLYEDTPLSERYNISSIYLNGMPNEELSHIDFHYNGYFEFLLSDVDGGQADYEQGSHSVRGPTENTVVTMNFKNATKECKASFIKKSNNDVIITHLRVPYKIVIDEVETDVFLWFFNGVFGGCPFSEEL